MKEEFTPRRIKVLRDSVAKRIAAGEVIDRPFSVVREILDNAIDAGSTEISLYITGGGIKNIRCIDNGCGMTKDDLKICFMPHATSKIEELDDLYKLQTLGFRGEALSSISACARLLLTSKVKEKKSGNTLKINNGNNVSLKEDKSRDGTIIDVSDLFYSMPARLKFLKRESTEAAACKNTFLEKALSFPEIAFKLFTDDKLKIFLPADSLKNRVIQAYQNVYNKDMTYEETQQFDNFSITAVLSGPSIYRKDRRHINIYVNKRKISEFALTQAVEFGYTGFLPGGCFPIASIFININPDLVDFNIHPAKREVKFINIQEIHRAIVRTIQKSLQSRSKDVSYIPESVFQKKMDVQQPQKVFEDFKPEYSHETKGKYSSPSDLKQRTQFIRSQAPSFRNHTDHSEESKSSFLNIVQNSSTEGLEIGESGTISPTMKYFGQIFSTFLLCTFDGTFYFVDQHAAHEKILYEKLCSQTLSMQEVLVPIVFSVEKNADIQIKNHLEDLHDSGIKIESAGYLNWQITAAAVMLQDHTDKIVTFLKEGKLEKENLSQKLYADIACKSAIKDGDVIDTIQAEQLISAVFQLENPRCPHGRPIWFSLTKDELFRFVGRIF